MSNEITVKLKCSIEKINEILEDKKFKIKRKYILDDTYFIPNDLDIKNMNNRDILSKAIILRDITEFVPKHKVAKLTFKDKKIAKNGDIIEQKKVDCEILNVQSGKEFLVAIGYKELMNIKEYDTVFEREGLEIAIKDVENGDNLIEVETVEEKYELNTTDKLIQQLEMLEIPIITDNYFVKKAEIELEEKLRK